MQFFGSFNISWNIASYVVVFLSIIVLFYAIWLLKTIKKLTAFDAKPQMMINPKAIIEKVLLHQNVNNLPSAGYLLHYYGVLVKTPDSVKTVLKKAHDRGLTTNIFRDSLGGGILLSSGERWRRSRRLVNTAFTSAKIEQYIVVFNEYSRLLVEKIQPFSNTEQIFNVSPFIARANIDIVTKNMTGNHGYSLANQDDRYWNMLEGVVFLDYNKVNQPWLFIPFFYTLYLTITKKKDLFLRVAELMLNIIEQRKQQKNESSAAGTYLDILMKEHERDNTFTQDDVSKNLREIIGAGFATISTLVSFTLLMLAIHQDVQDKVYHEIVTVLDDKNKNIQLDHLDGLVYLEQCINETLRRYSPVPNFFRKHSQDIVLNDKQTIPANSMILISPMILHWNEHLYPNPQIWDPNRFAVEAYAARDKYAFLPFGGGSKICPGAKYTLILAKIQLTHLIRAYHFSTDIKMQDIQLETHLFLRAKTGYPVKVQRRIKI